MLIAQMRKLHQTEVFEVIAITVRMIPCSNVSEESLIVYMNSNA